MNRMPTSDRTNTAMNQRKMMGSMTSNANVPSGIAIAAQTYIGSTSRQAQCANARTVNGAVPTVSISSSVTAATRAPYTAATSGM